MKTHFQEKLDELKMTLLEMAALTDKALEKALQAFFRMDADLAQEVVDGDSEVNRLEVVIDQQSLSLMALEQPVARDLRFIVGAIRMSINLERIADQAVNIAQKALHLSRQDYSPSHIPEDLKRLAEVASDMVRVAVFSFMNQNITQAWDVCQMDNEADDLNYRILRIAIQQMSKGLLSIEPAVQLIITARCLERVADQATNIAETVIFIVDGANIKHRCES